MFLVPPRLDENAGEQPQISQKICRIIVPMMFITGIFFLALLVWRSGHEFDCRQVSNYSMPVPHSHYSAVDSWHLFFQHFRIFKFPRFLPNRLTRMTSRALFPRLGKPLEGERFAGALNLFAAPLADMPKVKLSQLLPRASASFLSVYNRLSFLPRVC
jgi:hypothetical protein